MGYAKRPDAEGFGPCATSLRLIYLLIFSFQPGHNNWVRALVFHPSGKFLLSAADDKTIRVWELATGRCVKTVEAHGHFVATLAWGRQTSSGSKNANAAEGEKTIDEPEKLVNVVASGSVDQTVKIWLP